MNRSEMVMALIGGSTLVGFETKNPIAAIATDPKYFGTHDLNNPMNEWVTDSIKEALSDHPMLVEWYNKNWNNIDLTTQTTYIVPAPHA